MPTAVECWCCWIWHVGWHKWHIVFILPVSVKCNYTLFSLSGHWPRNFKLLLPILTVVHWSWRWVLHKFSNSTMGKFFQREKSFLKGEVAFWRKEKVPSNFQGKVACRLLQASTCNCEVLLLRSNSYNTGMQYSIKYRYLWLPSSTH